MSSDDIKDLDNMKATKKKKKKRKMPLFLKVLIAFVVTIIIAFIVICNVFTVKNVKVEGNTLYSNEKIKKTILNDEKSWNTLYVYLKYCVKDTEDMPFIDTMEVEMKNPHTLNIEVYEKGILGYIYIPSINSNAYFDKDGIVVEISKRIIPNVPKVEGLSCAKVVQYEKLPVKSDKLIDLLALTRAIKKYKIPPDSISYADEDAPVLKYNEVLVTLGKTVEYTPKIERVCQILKTVKDLKGTLHLEKWSSDNTNIVFEKTQ